MKRGVERVEENMGRGMHLFDQYSKCKRNAFRIQHVQVYPPQQSPMEKSARSNNFYIRLVLRN